MLTVIAIIEVAHQLPFSGIPLMLTVLSNVGKLLTKGLKYPFFLIKRWARRIFGFCLKMTPEQMMEADAKDRSRLEVTEAISRFQIRHEMACLFRCSIYPFL